jgi:haloacetate dehalogenase
MSGDLFPGFTEHVVETENGRAFARAGGDGPPVILLHGFPQTHACWHKVAPALAETHRVVCLDLRGYGRSAAPPGDPGHETYSKRAMGRDVAAVMRVLGHERFAVVGHDRGARVGYRLALDRPDCVHRLALLDILPTFEVWRKIEAGKAPAAHWDLLARPFPQPEEQIARDPVPFFDELFKRWTGDGTLDAFDPRALADYRAVMGEADHVHAFCEDYRAGATLDRQADEADFSAGRTIACPVLTLWGEFYLTRPNPGEETTCDVWRRTFAPQATGAQVDSGHFLAEEDPSGTLAALRRFLEDDA